jgi:uncharacterized protein YkwD
MNLKKTFVHYFVPHKRNKYKPHFLRIEVAGTVAAAIFVLFLGSVAQSHLLLNGSSQSAAVVASSLVDLANADRTQLGLPPLAVNSELQDAAQLKANDMAQNGYFAHTSPSGKDPWYWFEQAGYNFSYAGENLAVYFSDSNDVNTAWMNSPEHRANLLNPNYTEIGIATAQGMYQGVETTFVVQEFGTPAAVAAATQVPAPVQPAPAPAPSQPIAIAKPETPQVKGASVKEPPVKIVAQDQDAIAVQNTNATPAPQQTAGSTPVSADPVSMFALKFITSPESDLMVVYEIIGAIVALALMLEIGIEVRRQHPHRILVGVSLIVLMVLLVYTDHALLVGTVVIA